MKTRLRNAVLAAGLAALLRPAVRAEAAAVCALYNLADTSNPGCVTIRTCQEAILLQARDYINTWHTNQQQMVSLSLRGLNTTPQEYRCSGGPNNNSLCKGNNGGCTTGSKIGAACNTNSDCSGGTCNFGSGQGCNSNSAISLTGMLDQFQCLPQTEAAPFGDVMKTAKNTLAATITNRCNPSNPALQVDPMDLGLDRIPTCLIGQCAGGANAGDPCNTANPGGQCHGGSCDISNGDPTFATTYQKLIDCITMAAESDIAGGKTIDTIWRPLTKVTGTGKGPALAKPPTLGGPADQFPRQVLQMAGSSILQMGSGVPGNVRNNPTAGGAVTTLSLAHCVGGNGNPACTNKIDCGGGSCARNTSGGGVNSFTGAKYLNKCCSTSAAANVGRSCATDVDCGGAGGACAIHPNCLGNVLDVTENRSNGLTTCLVTRAKNSGNRTAARGTINLTTGDSSANVPTVTDVYLAPCARCIGGLCDGVGPGTCTASEGSTTPACLPTFPPLYQVPRTLTLTTGKVTMVATQATGGTCGFCDIGAANGICNNPPCNSCGTAPELSAGCASQPGRTCDTSILVTPKAFCGHCDSPATTQNGTCDHGGAGDQVCAIGCSDTAGASAECGTKTGKVGSVCDFGSVAPGFHGDCSVSRVEAQGEIHEFTPAVVGLFCAGKTAVSAPLNIDNLVGLPGLVHVYQPYIRAYVVSTDP